MLVRNGVKPVWCGQSSYVFGTLLSVAVGIEQPMSRGLALPVCGLNVRQLSAVPTATRNSVSLTGSRSSDAGRLPAAAVGNVEAYYTSAVLNEQTEAYKRGRPCVYASRLRQKTCFRRQ